MEKPHQRLDVVRWPQENSFIFAKDSRLPTVSDSTLAFANNERELIDRRLSPPNNPTTAMKPPPFTRFD